MFTKNKKLILLIILIPIIIIGIFSAFYYKNFFEKIDPSEIDSDLLIRNNSWQSPFLDSVPYKK
jgi:uncharacterized SAM-binding protein YcdF (DUF218 family)